ncbi:tetratricopeptide repeat protein [Synechocystis sp. B12]|nr:tetratricopeptide repeat protein [Synechocystis sp. B12]
MTSAWQNRGSALGVMGKLEEALANFDEALAQNPNDAEVWLSRGLLLEAMERKEEAIPSYEKALTLEPTLPEAQERLEELQGLLPQD